MRASIMMLFFCLLEARQTSNNFLELLGGIRMKDIRPKRRKSNDNPYNLESDISNNKYMVEFNDVNGQRHSIYISKEVYAALDQFELDDLKILLDS